MDLILCSVRDSAINAFIRPFCVPAVGAAVRGFTDEVNNPDSPMNKHPDDYELFELGVFSEETGYVTMLPQPRAIARAKDFHQGERHEADTPHRRK